jgi:hypothetical protein
LGHVTDRAERHDSRQLDRFGRYRIHGVLGEGGMGRLYVAEQNGIEGFAKIVALKRILPHLADNEHFQALFFNEARVAARLEHPNIVATHELGEVDGTYFTAMEYLPGEDLAAVLAKCDARGAMPVEIATALAQQAACGLHYAHTLADGAGRRSGLVHRDVNPSNIFVTYHGVVKLLDFGVVKLPGNSSHTSPGAFKGKYAYCAPEQIEGGAIDHRTDVFSLGIVLWECLAGRALFLGPNDAATIDAVRTRQVVPPSKLRRELPGDLDDIALRALNRDRDKRFQSAQELNDALERFLAKRRNRPTSQSIGQWLEALFGAERAAAKKAIAQGGDVAGALALLSGGTPTRPVLERPVTGSEPGAGAVAAVRPRAMWSATAGGLKPTGARPITSSGHGPVPRVDPPPALEPELPAPPAARATKTRAIMVIGALVVAGAGAAAWLSQRQSSAPAPAPAAASSGAVEIVSEPAGGNIFVDDDPSGLTTPATITGLRAGRAVSIRVDKEGFEHATLQVDVVAGQTLHRALKLLAASGILRLDGLPPGSKVFLDDTLVEVRGPLTAPLGPHRLRVERADDVVFSETIDVRAGSHTLKINTERRTK